MANIIETNNWSEAIYEIATTDDVIGGTDGISNIQATQLAARTNFLKGRVGRLETHVANLETGATSAGQAVKLTTARAISINGDATGNAAFDGTTDVTINLTQKDSGVKAGIYSQVTVDTKGRVVNGNNPTTLAGYGITDAASISFVQQAVLPAGTRMPFAQSGAPRGWTQVNDDSTNNRMLRVVNDGGGNYGGVHNPVINTFVPAHTHWFTTGYISADHTHTINDPGHAHSIRDPGHAHGISVRARNSSGQGIADSGDKVTYGATTNFASTGIAINAAGTGMWNNGVSSNHTHSGATDNGSSQTNWQPRYIDMIICVKN